MENQNIKRGVDFDNRVGASRIAFTLQNAFAWWKGRKLNKTTLLFIATVFVVNLLVVYPLFGRNVVPSFSSSALLALAGILENADILAQDQFFSLLVVFSILAAPISYYLFVRRTAMRHDLTAFVATLFFVLPNPMTNNGSVLTSAILNGDGGHVVTFSFIPLLLLYMQAFISTGFSVWGFITILITALIAIVSPFAMFNLLILFVAIAISEGFFRNLREKFLRLLFLLVSSFLLSFFWYYPNVITQIIVLSHVSYIINKLVSILPILIPIIPIVGLLLFLVFDRREKLKPVFLGLFLFIIYIFLYFISRDLKIAGILTSDRYLLELTFSASYLFAMIFVLVTELLFRGYIFRIKNNVLLFLSIFGFVLFAFLFISFAVEGVLKTHVQLGKQPIINSYKFGIGNIGRAFNFNDISIISASSISLLTFIFLLFFLSRSSAVVKAKEGELSSQEESDSQKGEGERV